MRYFLQVITLFVLLVLQGGIVNRLLPAAGGNLVLVYVILASIAVGLVDGISLALVGGLMLDLSSRSLAGVSMIAMASVFGLSYFLINKFMPREPNAWVLATSVVLGTVVFDLVFVIIISLLHVVHIAPAADWKYIFGSKLLLDLAVNLFFAYPIYQLSLVVQKLEKRLALT
jgi:cell shape-determining protein MreD